MLQPYNYPLSTVHYPLLLRAILDIGSPILAMRYRSLAALIGILALTAIACGGEPETTTEEGTETPEAAETEVAPAAETEAAEAQPFEDPTVDPQPPQVLPAPGLIASTDPQERARQVLTGAPASDPFGVLTTPTVEGSLPDDVVAAAARAETGDVPSGSPLPPISPEQTSNLPDLPDPVIPDISVFLPGGVPLGTTGTDVTSLPSTPAQGAGNLPDLPDPVIPDISAVPPIPEGETGIEEAPAAPPQPEIALPPIPQPTLARTIEVVGVIQVGGETQIIVRTPSDPTGRYVSVGQRLLGGRVLVRRVETNRGAEPVVIFEENGVEVARAVGEPVILPENEGANVVARGSL